MSEISYRATRLIHLDIQDKTETPWNEPRKSLLSRFYKMLVDSGIYPVNYGHGNNHSHSASYKADDFNRIRDWLAQEKVVDETPNAADTGSLTNLRGDS